MPPIKRNKYDWTNPYDPKFPGLNLDPKVYNAMLREYGVRVNHEKAVACPNYKGNINSGNHPVACPFCKGQGFVYYGAEQFTALFQSNTLQRMFRQEGWLDPGTATLSCPCLLEDKRTIVYLQYFDRITLIDFEDRYNELIQRSKGNVDPLRYTALQVEYLVTKNASYTEGKEFEIDDNGNIKWLNKTRPGLNEVPVYGEVYTIAYLYRPVYRIVHLLHEGRFSQRKLKTPSVTPERFPQQVIIKKDFLLEKTDSETGDTIQRPIVP